MHQLKKKPVITDVYKQLGHIRLHCLFSLSKLTQTQNTHISVLMDGRKIDKNERKKKGGVLMVAGYQMTT